MKDKILNALKSKTFFALAINIVIMALIIVVIFIHIDFRLRQHFLHGGEIALPVGRGNKSVRLAIGVQPYLGDAVDICFSQFSNHDNFSASSHSVRRQALSGSPR